MKRFTATEKWDKAWFQDLSLGDKCLWNYLCENCDAAGVWDVNWRLASFQIGATFNEASLVVFGERVEVLSTGKVWIRGFCEFQYGQLSRDCKGHKYVFLALERHKLLDRVSHLLHSLSDRVSDTLQDKDKDKEEDQDKLRKGEQGETDPDAVAKAERRSGIAALGQRVGVIFHRKPGSKWSEKERKAVVLLYPQPEEDVALIERYYAAQIAAEKDIRRRDLQTLLNNWSGELDRARKHFGVNGPAPSSQTAAIPPEKLAAFLALPEHAGYQNVSPPPTSRAAMPHSMRADWERWIDQQKP